MALRAVAPGSAAVNSSQIVGTTTNNNAAAGIVGEYVESIIPVGSAVSLTTGTAANVTSLSLTAGDWDINAIVVFGNGVGTVVLDAVASISLTTDVQTARGKTDRGEFVGFTGQAPQDSPEVSVGPTRLALNATTTVYLVAAADFSVSTLNAYGQIRARRVR